MAHSPRLPTEILDEILGYLLFSVPTEKVKTFLDLRLVNRFCNQEVFRILVEENRLAHAYLDVDQEIEPTFTFRYWQECLKQERKYLATEDETSTIDDEDTQSECSGLILFLKYDGGILRAKLLSTIDMLMSMPENPTFADLESLISDDVPSSKTVSSSNDAKYSLWEMKLFKAFIVLAGSRLPTLLLLSDESPHYTDSWYQRTRFYRRSREYFALIVFAHEGNLRMTQCFLNLIEAKYKQELSSGLIKGDPIEPPSSTGSSSFDSNSLGDSTHIADQRHRIEWYDALQACLFLSSCHQDRTMFRDVLGRQVYSENPKFCSIIYNRQTLLQWVARKCAIDVLKIMVAYRWATAGRATEDAISDLGQAVLIVQRMSVSTPGRIKTLELLSDAGSWWQDLDLLDLLICSAAKNNDTEFLQHVFDRLDTKPAIARYSIDHDLDQFMEQDPKDPLEYAMMHHNLDMLQLLLANRFRITQFINDQDGTFMDPSSVMSKLIMGNNDIDYTCLKELLCAVPEDSVPGRLFAAAADRISIECIPLFARYVDLSAPASCKPKTSPAPTVGEEALNRVLSKLQVEKAKILIEDFGIRSAGFCVRELAVSEKDEAGMQALKEIQILLDTHGITFQKSITNNVSFCSPVNNDLQHEDALVEAGARLNFSSGWSSSSSHQLSSEYCFDEAEL